MYGDSNWDSHHPPATAYSIQNDKHGVRVRFARQATIIAYDL